MDRYWQRLSQLVPRQSGGGSARALVGAQVTAVVAAAAATSASRSRRMRVLT